MEIKCLLVEVEVNVKIVLLFKVFIVFDVFDYY